MGSTRRRGAELERAILRAALDELAEAGYAGLTMDRVVYLPLVRGRGSAR